MSYFDRLGEGFGGFVINNRILTIILSIILVALIASGARFLTFDTSYRAFFSKDNPQLKAFDELQNVYTKTDNALFVLKPKHGDVFNKNLLSAVKDITKAAWQLPFSTRVDSITNYQHTEAIDDDLIVADLAEGDPNELTSEQINKIKNIVLNEPLIKDRLISEDGKVTGINVIFQFPEKSVFEVPDATAKVREIVSIIEKKYPDIIIKTSGILLLNNAFSEISQNELSTLVPIMYLVLIISLLIFLKSIGATIATFFVIFFSALTAMGVAGFLGIKLTPPSASAPTIILTLAIADSVHIIISMIKNIQRGQDKNSAIIDSLRINFQPVFLTSITTIIGFLSLNFSDAPPFRDMGNIVAFGIGFAFIFSVTFLPAILSLLPINIKAKNKDESKQSLLFLSNFVINKRNYLFAFMIAILLLSAYMMPKIQINDQFVQYFDKTVPFRTDTEFIMDNLSGIYQAEYSVKAKNSGGISDPEYLKILENFVHWLKIQKEVDHVYSVTDIFKRLNKNMHSDDNQYYKLPDEKELAAQYLLLYEMSLPYGLDLNDRINIDKSATRITVILKDISTNEVKDFKDRSEKWLKYNAPSYMETESTSPVIMFSFISERNINSMIKGNLVALFLVSMCLVFALKNFKYGVISLLPNLAPVIMGFGIWALLVTQINMAVAFVAAISLGIIVDDTVHFMSKYARARRENNLDCYDAVRYAFSTVGMALIITTIVLVLGFSVLLFSVFKVNETMGMLTAIIISCALIIDFLLLPPLLMYLDKNRS